MDILYVRKKSPRPNWTEARIIKGWDQYHGSRQTRLFDHFFLASLDYHNNVSEVYLTNLKQKSAAWTDNFDAVVFNFWRGYKKSFCAFETLPEDLNKVKTPLKNVPKVLLLLNDKPDILPTNSILNFFDLVFKREVYKDRDRYSRLSDENREKLCTTILPNFSVPVNRDNLKDLDLRNHGCSAPPNKFTHEVFFNGGYAVRERLKIVELLKESHFDFKGGLQSVEASTSEGGRILQKVPDKFAAPRLNPSAYRSSVRRSKINLALSGTGPFTLRHLEIWYLSSFMITTNKINKLELPLDVKPGEDYVTYETHDELRQKIAYYLKHPSQRKQISQSGRQSFVEGYNFNQHGSYITQKISSIT